MAINISKECFPPPTKCFNCERKSRQGLTKTTEAVKELKRCSGCHLMSYCDKNCQIEHWDKVHKKHCKLLSGKKVVEGVKHVADSCTLCIQEKETLWKDIISCDSPKTKCNVEYVIQGMKSMLGLIFQFHGEGKSCSCSKTFGCNLPFPLGEITGAYVGSGRDEMFAHAIKILGAMRFKKGRLNSGLQQKIEECYCSILFMRASNWRNFLVEGDELKGEKVPIEIVKLVYDIKISYGTKDAWMEILLFTASFIHQMASIQGIMQRDRKSLEDPRFPIMKRMHCFSESQLKLLQENHALLKFRLWPSVNGDSLAILLPDDIHCGNCKALLTGPVCVDLGHEEDDSRPVLMPHTGQLGGLVASCPVSERRDCWVNCKIQDMYYRIKVEGLMDQLEQEYLLFINEIRYCDMCLTASLTSHRCSQCLASQYCSTQCQRQDLSFHKTVCSAWAKDKARKLIRGKKQVEKNAAELKEYYDVINVKIKK